MSTTKELQEEWRKNWSGTQRAFCERYNINEGNFSSWLRGKDSPASVRAVRQFLEEERKLKPKELFPPDGGCPKEKEEEEEEEEEEEASQELQKEWRKNWSGTQRAFCERYNINEGHFSSWLRGKPSPASERAVTKYLVKLKPKELFPLEKGGCPKEKEEEEEEEAFPQELQQEWRKNWSGTQRDFCESYAINEGNFSSWLRGKDSPASVRAVTLFLEERKLKPKELFPLEKDAHLLKEDRTSPLKKSHKAVDGRMTVSETAKLKEPTTPTLLSPKRYQPTKLVTHS